MKGTTITLIVGAGLTIVGFVLWGTTDIGGRVFQLSNDLIGAGVFVTLTSLMNKIFK